MEIAPNVHKIDSVTGGRPLQLYLLVGGDRTVLIDAGGSSEPENIIFPYLERLELTPSDIDMVIVTHSDHDHFGGLGAIKNANPAVALTCGDQDRFMVEDPETTYSFRYNHYAADHGIAFDDDARAAIMEDLGNAQQIDVSATQTTYGSVGTPAHFVPPVEPLAPARQHKYDHVHDEHGDESQQNHD